MVSVRNLINLGCKTISREMQEYSDHLRADSFGTAGLFRSHPVYITDYLPLPNNHHSTSPPSLPAVPPRPASNILDEQNSFIPVQPPIDRPTPPTPEDQPITNPDYASTVAYSESITDDSSESANPSSPESENPVPIFSYPLTSPACPPIQVPSPPAIVTADTSVRRGSLAERIAILREVLDMQTTDSNPSSAASRNNDVVPTPMSSSPDTPASPINDPQPTPYGLNSQDDCEIPLVEFLNIDSTLITRPPRSVTPDSEQSENDDITESIASKDVDPEAIECVNAIVRYQKLTMFRFGIMLQSAPYVNIPLLAEAEIALLGKLCSNVTLSCGYCTIDGLYQIRSPTTKPLLATVYPEPSRIPSYNTMLKLETVERPYCIQEFRVLSMVTSSLQQRMCLATTTHP